MSLIVDPSSRIGLISYSYSQIDYSLRCMFPRWSDWEITLTRQGLLKKRIRQALSYIIFAAGIVGLYQVWNSARNVGVTSWPGLLQQRVGSFLLELLGSVERRISRIRASI